MASAPPLVLVHGLWDTPRLFNRLKIQLDNQRYPLLIPYLSSGLGATPILELAQRLGSQIEATFGAHTQIDLLGFSMGGVVARSWIQLQGGQSRTRRFISVGSPQQGTLTAQPWPSWLLAGIADMKWGSPLLRQLNTNLDGLDGVDCCSFYCATDLMVLPGWHAVLPLGPRQQLPVRTHQQLLQHPSALEPLVAELLRP
ncbi:MAG: alpha/beta hydrolase [Cyanobacteria bacterium]|jgi:triacylglycerol lipase|nr:alpha/beta hydrolase [Cyanobacteriota bacterium]MDA1246494.1 alpha/beta hydrolase [Cyanobacteriota bacterium]